jgi:uncharacterized protein (TIGR03067 family)
VKNVLFFGDMWTKSNTILPVACLAIIIAKGAEPPNNELNGKWVVKSVERDPRRSDQGRGKGFEITISNELVMAKKPGHSDLPPAFLVELHQDSKPWAVDIWVTDFFLDKTREQVLAEPPVLAIYELKGDLLRVCFSPLEARSRPVGFEITTNSSSTLVTLQRQNPK